MSSIERSDVKYQDLSKRITFQGTLCANVGSLLVFLLWLCSTTVFRVELEVFLRQLVVVQCVVQCEAAITL